jgi:hypothetical protein
MKQDRRGSWYLLTGLVIGIAIGLGYSWMVSPVKYIDAPPYALRDDYKAQYRVLIAVAYLYSGDLVRAEDRLAELKDDNIIQTISRQAQQAQSEGHPDEEIRALNMLASALSQGLAPAPTNPDSLPGAVPTSSPSP